MLFHFLLEVTMLALWVLVFSVLSEHGGMSQGLCQGATQTLAFFLPSLAFCVRLPVGTLCLCHSRLCTCHLACLSPTPAWPTPTAPSRPPEMLAPPGNLSLRVRMGPRLV